MKSTHDGPKQKSAVIAQKKEGLGPSTDLVADSHRVSQEDCGSPKGLGCSRSKENSQPEKAVQPRAPSGKGVPFLGVSREGRKADRCTGLSHCSP